MAQSWTSTMIAQHAANAPATDSISINGSPPRLLKQMPEEHGQAHNRDPKKYKHAFAVHAEERTSCLSRDSKQRPSFHGLRNLMVLIVIVSNLRLMIENFKKYGILVTLSGAKIRPVDWRWAGLLYVLTPCHLFCAYLIELLAARAAKDVLGKEKRSRDGKDEDATEDERKAVFSTWRVIAVAHALNATAMLVYSTYVVYYLIHNPGIGTFSELHAVIVWLKVCSYALTNRDMRRAMLSTDVNNAQLPSLYKQCPYPRNITVSNLSYFWWAPTLIYQPVYPRNARRRWDFILKRTAEFFVCSVLIWVASAQYAVPLLENSLQDISRLHLVNMLERVLKLSTISLFCWLAGFFALFQAFLNGLAELMRFADREFYGDWWNSTNLRGYWTSWNKPVTHFMKRHIYAPMVARGVWPPLAQLLTFLFSGLLHELLVGVPTHNILGVAFAGMVMQLPLIFLTDPLATAKSHNVQQLGNYVFWFTFVMIGQPVAALAYFFAWQAKYGERNRPEWPLV